MQSYREYIINSEQSIMSPVHQHSAVSDHFSTKIRFSFTWYGIARWLRSQCDTVIMCSWNYLPRYTICNKVWMRAKLQTTQPRHIHPLWLTMNTAPWQVQYVHTPFRYFRSSNLGERNLLLTILQPTSNTTSAYNIWSRFLRKPIAPPPPLYPSWCCRICISGHTLLPHHSPRGKKLCGLSLRANYNDRATAACRQS
jgi:hypothetical protein